MRANRDQPLTNALGVDASSIWENNAGEICYIGTATLDGAKISATLFDEVTAATLLDGETIRWQAGHQWKRQGAYLFDCALITPG
jgi:hypothetical protein